MAAWVAPMIAAVASVMGSVAQQQGSAKASAAQRKADEEVEARTRRDKAYEMNRANVSEAAKSNQEGIGMLLNSFQRALKR